MLMAIEGAEHGPCAFRLRLHEYQGWDLGADGMNWEGGWADRRAALISFLSLHDPELANLLISVATWSATLEWRSDDVLLVFSTKGDAALFKLTFGGAREMPDV